MKKLILLSLVSLCSYAYCQQHDYSDHLPAATPLGLSAVDSTYSKQLFFLNSDYGNKFISTLYSKDSGAGRTSLRFAVKSSARGWADALIIQNSDAGNGHGSVGVGGIDDLAKFYVFQERMLPAPVGSFMTLTSVVGIGNSYFKSTKWLHRYKEGGTWASAALHDGISIDNSFLTPGVSTRTWWDRRPYDNVQSWGDLDQTYLTINKGKVGIGITNPQEALDVNGVIRTKEVLITDTGWADFVFEDDYNLPELETVESHIKTHKRLPGIPSATEVLNHGVGVGEMNVKLLQKVEELTLYIIEQQKQLAAQQKQLTELQQKLNVR